MSQIELPTTFYALRVDVDGDETRRHVANVGFDVLPDHDVTVAVSWSSLNYKDALSATGNRGVTRRFPHTPGIDAAGTVLASRDPRYQAGDRVLCTGFDLGMDTPGGFGQVIRVPGDWLVPLPEGLDERTAMAIGTAGLTAAMALDALERHGVTPELGPAAVTGASGGVGTMAVALLAAAGFEVIASTGSERAHPLLLRLGASAVEPREELAAPDAKPMARGRYGCAVDTVGGTTLVNLVKRATVGGAVAACGMVGGADLDLNVFPFILRGVALLGIDSQHLAMARRQELWARLAGTWRPRTLLEDAEAVSEVDLAQLSDAIQGILAGRTVGRVVVRLERARGEA